MADFAVTVPSAELVLGADRKGATTVTVTNTSGRPMRARLNVVVTDPAKVEWFTYEPMLDLPLGATQQRQVQLAVPANVSEATLTARYDVVPEDRPDAALPGPSQSFKVAPARKPFPWWIIAVAAGVVVLAGIIIFVLSRSDPAPKPVARVPVPTIVGLSQAAAKAAVENNGLKLKVVKAGGAPVCFPTVVTQSPGPGQLADEGSDVVVTIPEANKVALCIRPPIGTFGTVVKQP